MASPDGIRGILLDVEGTTTPISFVHETLFPFARARLDSCARAMRDPGIAEAVQLLRADHRREHEAAGVPDFGDGARSAV